MKLVEGNIVRFIEESGNGDPHSIKNELYKVVFASMDTLGISPHVRMVRLGEPNPAIVHVLATRVELVAYDESETPFHVGDKVVVKDSGQAYGRFKYAAKAMSLDNWSEGSYVTDGETYTVVTACKHPFSGPVYAVENEHGRQYLIGVSGLEAYVEPPQPVILVFNIGDRVRVLPTKGHDRQQCNVHGFAASNTFVDSMERYIGSTFIVEDFGSSGYWLKGIGWGWMPQWLEAAPLTIEEELEQTKDKVVSLEAEIARLSDSLDITTKELTASLKQVEAVRQALAA